MEVSAVMLVARSTGIADTCQCQTFGTREWIRDLTIGSSVPGPAVGLIVFLVCCYRRFR
jgi:hypothetical protein